MATTRLFGFCCLLTSKRATKQIMADSNAFVGIFNLKKKLSKSVKYLHHVCEKCWGAFTDHNINYVK